MVQSDGAKCGFFANAQDDIYKSAPSPVILEERSDEESQTEPLPNFAAKSFTSFFNFGTDPASFLKRRVHRLVRVQRGTSLVLVPRASAATIGSTYCPL